MSMRFKQNPETQAASVPFDLGRIFRLTHIFGKDQTTSSVEIIDDAMRNDRESSLEFVPDE